MKLVLFLIGLTGLVYGETRVYQGVAKFEGKVVYEEKHQVTFEGGKITKTYTEYFDADKKLIGKLSNDYTKSLSAPEHSMEDLRLKNQHGLRYKNLDIELFNHDDGEKEEHKLIGPGDYKGKLVVASQGLHYYLVAHMEEVLKKGKLDLKFLIPGKLDAYDFYLKVLHYTDEKAEMEIKIDNWFLRLFAPRLKLIYDLKKKQLIHYEGLSNIKNSKGDMMSVDIEYRYQD